MKRLAKEMNKYFKTHVVFIIIAAVFGVYFIFTIPLLWGYDETVHFARAYQISSGELQSKQVVKNNFGGNLPKNYIDFANGAHEDLADNSSVTFFTRRDVNSNAPYNLIAKQQFSDQKRAYVFNGSAAYSPAAYTPASIGVVVARLIHLNIGSTIQLVRTFSLAMYIVLSAVSLYLLRNSRAKYLLFVIALLPMSISQAATVSADGLANGLGLLLFSLFIYAWNNKFYLSRKIYFLLVLAVVLLPLAKLNYIFLCFPFVFIKMPFTFNKFDTKKLYFRIGLLAALLLPALTWLVINRNITSHFVSDIPFLNQTVNPGLQLQGIISGPQHFIISFIKTLVRHGDDYIYGFNGVIGWNYVGVPYAVMVLIAIVTTVALFQAKEEDIPDKNYKKFLTLLGTLGILTSLGIFVAFYLTFTPLHKSVIDGVQGRYFLLLAPFVLYGLAQFLPFSIKEKSANKSLTFYSFGMVAILLISSIWYFIGTY